MTRVHRDDLSTLDYTPNPVFAFLDGKPYRRGTITGTFRHDVQRCTYPYPRVDQRLTWRPDAAGRKSAEYQERRRQLGDDWDADMTDAIETYCDVAHQLGYPEAGDED